MTTTAPLAGSTDRVAGPGRARWPLAATAAGALGFVATLVLDGRNDVPAEVRFTDGFFDGLDPVVYRLSLVLGYAAVVMLLLLAAQWRRRVEPRVPASTAAPLVTFGLVSAAAGLTYGYGWKGALGLYLPDGAEGGAFDDAGLTTYFMLNDFGSWIGWLGVVVAAAGIAWMGLRERTVSRWIGVVSVLPVLQTTAMVLGLGVPGVPALLAPLYLVVLGLGLTFGRSVVTR
ncbi:hypothetical protein [Nocardioides deserti]|uniref:DUF4386 family protein n=1 Tax=Nocardioides deserti TaxID=1588644 RepID=A0ABR6UCI6_9ACTN|nr:hypothetical protein [Nocardioides deserti]MBC2961818.1 hypothetical protein [Nocardioides deserti]GGO79380.1 hypothetical protein GCM10012276_38990 [Nocardioides deserti]